MKIKETGFIVFMERFERALEFYEGGLGLRVRVRKAGLAQLDFGGSYLMIEDGGAAAAAEKTRAQNPTVIRLDVTDFEETVEELRERGVDVLVQSFGWGTIGTVIDPEGNRIELKKAEE